MRGRVTVDGLYVAFGFVLAVLGLLASIIGLAMGPGDQLARYVAVGGISMILLLGLLYLQFAPGGEEKFQDDSRPERSPFLRLELFWGGVAALSCVGLVLVNGPSRAVWVLLVAVSTWQLVRWERRRRREGGEGD